MVRALDQHWDSDGGGFFDRAADAPPMGGLEVRRKPLQDSPSSAGNAIAVMVLDRLHGYTGDALYRDRAEATLGAFAGAVPQYGLFAASYAQAAVLHSRGAIEVVVTGRADDPAAQQLERAAAETFRFGKSVLRITSESHATMWLAPALAETLPHLGADVAQALVCTGTTCQPPISDAAQLRKILLGPAAAVMSS
jgi:uncharacterized protein YyaL (SSP411 family)